MTISCAFHRSSLLLNHTVVAQRLTEYKTSLTVKVFIDLVVVFNDSVVLINVRQVTIVATVGSMCGVANPINALVTSVRCRTSIAELVFAPLACKALSVLIV